MQEHLVSPYAYLPCTGTYHSPNDKGNQAFHNWDPFVNQQMDMPTALAYSCDTYFYQLGDLFYCCRRAAGSRSRSGRAIFGFGSPTGTDSARRRRASCRRSAGAAAALHDRQIDKLWKPGNSIQLAIGQGDLTSRRCRWRASTRCSRTAASS